jgi:NAD(P)-dependent dehydrogenase (short-subunit alcohol dehydrogenase family)
MDLQLTGKTAIVTGASKGMGLALTRTFLDEGARVIAASRKRTEELEALEGDLLHVPADLMDPEAPAELVARAVEVFGGLDILVNNVGGPPPGVHMPRASFFDATDEEWRAMFELNLFAAVRASRAAILIMLESDGGAIVNISSTHAKVPFPNVDYSAAKAAINSLTVSLSEEFAPQGIRVNTVSPGPVRTPWWTDDDGVADFIAGQSGTDREGALATVAPEMMSLSTGRLAEPQEIADVVALLASPRSGSTTGSDFVVDSGMVKSV